VATSDAGSEIRIRRVVVALDATTAPSAALDAAAALASGLGAELVGLFVEDQQLLRFAALPFAQELGIATASARPVRTADIERALKSQAERLRRVLAETARPLGLAWTLEVTRGEVVRAAVAYAGDEDLLVIGRARYLSISTGPPPAGLQFPTLRARTVAALYDGTPAAVRALVIAHTLARVARSELAVLIAAGGPEPFRALRVAAGQVLGAHGATAAAYVMVPGTDPASIERAARAQRARVLLWPGAHRERAAETVAALLADVSCPVVMLG